MASYHKDKKAHQAYGKKWRQKYIEFIKSHKTECVVCGEKENVCLDFHHLDPTQKDFNLARQSKYQSFEKIKKEIDKCIIVCSNCHRKIHAGLIILDHGPDETAAVLHTAIDKV